MQGISWWEFSIPKPWDLCLTYLISTLHAHKKKQQISDLFWFQFVQNISTHDKVFEYLLSLERTANVLSKDFNNPSRGRKHVQIWFDLISAYVNHYQCKWILTQKHNSTFKTNSATNLKVHKSSTWKLIRSNSFIAGSNAMRILNSYTVLILVTFWYSETHEKHSQLLAEWQSGQITNCFHLSIHYMYLPCKISLKISLCM